MRWTDLQHELAHPIHRKCNIGPYGHYCIHERSYPSLIWNTFHFPLYTPNSSSEWNSNMFAFFHVETLENLFEVFLIVYSGSLCFFIPLKFHSWVIMQFSKIAHLKFFLKLRFEPLQLDYIVCWHDQIHHVEDCHRYILTRLFHVQRIICLAPTKASVDQNK